MIAAVIFIAHVLAAAYAFFTRKKQGGVGEGILAVAFFTIIFSVGWTITTMVTNLFLRPEGFAPWFDRDAFTLTLLTIGEGVFYSLLLRSQHQKKHEGGVDSGKTTSK
ncbi:MAG: hypothetical protein HYW57_06050 [Ignavibacteriales bacterium]|nr:hypothetical protein [Ignavibacteriales bacterium]